MSPRGPEKRPGGCRGIGPGRRYAGELNRQPLAALCPAGIDRPAAGAGRHSCPEAVPSFPLQVAGLERSFHVVQGSRKGCAILCRAPRSVNAGRHRADATAHFPGPPAGNNKSNFLKIQLLLLVGRAESCAQRTHPHDGCGFGRCMSLLKSAGVTGAYPGCCRECRKCPQETPVVATGRSVCRAIGEVVLGAPR